MPMNPTELRAALAPLVKLFKGLADVSAIIDDVIAQETRLVGLRKEHADLTKGVATLNSDRSRLAGEINTLRSSIDKASADYRTADSELKTKQGQLDKAQSEHDARLAKSLADHEKALAVATKKQADELDSLRSQRAGVMAELTAAKNQLADFHDRLSALKK